MRMASRTAIGKIRFERDRDSGGSSIVRLLTSQNPVDQEIPRSGVDQVVGIGRLADCDMIGVDADRIDVKQSRIAAVVADDHSHSSAALLVEDLVLNRRRPVTVPAVEVPQIGVVLHEVERRRRRPGDQPQCVEQRRVRRSGVGCCDEDDTFHVRDEGGRFGIKAATGVGSAQELLDDQPAQAVAYEDQRSMLQLARAKQTFQDVPRTILDRHADAQPIARGSVVGECPGREARNVA
jgi:hypothetical protein